MGRYICGRGRAALFYDEVQEGMENCSVMITVSGDSVSIKRRGSYESYMLYERGRLHTVAYKTPYGEMAMDFRTKIVETEFSPEGAYIRLFYTIEMGKDTTEAELTITAKTV